MLGTNLTASLAVLLILSSVGCKSMPSLTWWRTASNEEAADNSAVARTAPALPSDVAIQTEGLASPGSTTANTASASPYVSTGAPAVSPGAYPSTGAPTFSPPDPTATASSPSVASAPASHHPSRGFAHLRLPISATALQGDRYPDPGRNGRVGE